MRTTRTRRRAVFRAAAVIITTAALGLGVAPAAFADTAPVTVSAVRTAADGAVSVSLNTNDKPLWVQIRVRASAAPDAATLLTTDTEETNGGATAAPVRLPAGTAYGDYPVDVDFRLPGGTAVQHWTAADHGTTGLLDYRKHASVTELTSDRATTDYDHRTVVLSGKVRLLDPATGDTSEASAGTHVRIKWEDENRLEESVSVDTDATGAFSHQVTAHDSILNGSAVVENPAPDTTVGAIHYLPIVYASPAVYRISATASRTVAHWHDTFTMSGSVQRLTDDGWVPFGGLPVETSSGPGSFRVFGTGVTAADGTFSYPTTAVWTTTLYTYAQQSPYLQYTADDSNYLDVPTAGSITLPAFTIDKFATVKTTGRLNGRCRYQTLDLQYSPNGKTGWVTIAHTTTGGLPGTTCSYYMPANGGWDGYYRVYHPETPWMLPVVTPTYRLHRTRTSMSLTMTPSRPYPNAKLTATGVVTQLTSAGWVHYTNAHVVLVFKPKGDPNGYGAVKVSTNSSGRFTFTTQAHRDGTWTAYLDADSAHFSSETRQVYVDVR
jgi:hypothetical protein